MVRIESTPEMVAKTYAASQRNLEVVRRRLGRPLTLADKVLLGHLDDPERGDLEPGVSYRDLRPDRVALQDVLGQTVMLSFMQTRKARTAVPTTVHCDHLIQARVEGGSDLLQSLEENEEVFDFLRSASARFGVGFWGPGAGIIHQVVLEQYAYPGALIIGTDSHTPNAGGLGACARRGRGRRRRRGDGRTAVGGALPAPRGRPAHRRDGRLDRAQGRHPLPGWRADGVRRHERDHRVLRPRREVDKLHRQGDHHEHGRRAGRDHVDIRVRRAHGHLPALHGTGRPGRPRRPEQRPAGAGRGGRTGPGELLRPGGRDRPVAPGTPRRRPALA